MEHSNKNQMEHSNENLVHVRSSKRNYRDKTIVTITGIRPDFIRMSRVFAELDKNFNHICICTGQHYDELLAGVFFKELQIRKPDYILNTGENSKNHYEQLAYLSVKIPELINNLTNNSTKPDLILFLGDSNSVCASLPLKKEGYNIGHIEAGMRSRDRRMLEEINRTVCDHCSDIFFVYHKDYKTNLIAENIPAEKIHVVGNTIVEPCLLIRSRFFETPKRNDMILIDIHRPENFNYPQRLQMIFEFARCLGEHYNIPIKLLYFKRLVDVLSSYQDVFNINPNKIEIIDLMPYQKYLETAYHCHCVISDSGSACEELPLIDVPVIVPRDFTERPQSYESHCSMPLYLNEINSIKTNSIKNHVQFIDNYATNSERNIDWLLPNSSEFTTSQLIINHIKTFLKKPILY